MNDTFISHIMRLIEDEIHTSNTMPIIGLSGPQGCGKSTALNYITEHSPYNIAGLGLDDFYLPKSDREKLSQNISPLFKTRGPAGTHDISLLEATLDVLLNAEPNSQCLVPTFDKRCDDRCPRDQRRNIKGVPDAIVVEGWMIGAILPPDFLTSEPLNEVEARDTHKAWRREQFDHLSGPYADLWNRIDHFIHISGPGFETVEAWRMEQEATNLGVCLDDLPGARRDWVSNFVQYFERLTRSMHAGYIRQGTRLHIDKHRNLIAEV